MRCVFGGDQGGSNACVPALAQHLQDVIATASGALNCPAMHIRVFACVSTCLCVHVCIYSLLSGQPPRTTAAEALFKRASEASLIDMVVDFLDETIACLVSDKHQTWLQLTSLSIDTSIDRVCIFVPVDRGRTLVEATVGSCLRDGLGSISTPTRC